MDDQLRARFARIREQVRASAKAIGQASLATGVLVLVAPAGGFSPETNPDEIGVVAYEDAAPEARVSHPANIKAAADTVINDFDDAFSDFSDSTFGQV